MMREARLHPIERPDEGPQNAYGEEEIQNRVLERLEEEAYVVATREEAIELYRSTRLLREAEGPLDPEVTVDASEVSVDASDAFEEAIPENITDKRT